MLLSIKDEKNIATHLYSISNYDKFMSISNQIYITKMIYNLHKRVADIKKNGYLYFKSIVPINMENWAIARKINNLSFLYENNTDILDYINKIFLRENIHLYSNPFVNIDGAPQLNGNPFRDSVGISCDVNTIEKNPLHLLADDYNKLDFGKNENVETRLDNYRYGNKIPIWQKSMNIRHYDKSNEGFRDKYNERSSLTNNVYGYDMSSIYNSL